MLLLSLVAIGTACHKPYFFFKSGIYRKIVALPIGQRVEIKNPWSLAMGRFFRRGSDEQQSL